MPRFFFHVVGKNTDRDTEGTQLPSAAFAKREGLKLIGAMLSDGFYDSQGCAILLEIMDETGLVLFHIDLTTWDAPVGRAAQLVASTVEADHVSRSGRASDGGAGAARGRT